jgi:hypothetical protein
MSTENTLSMVHCLKCCPTCWLRSVVVTGHIVVSLDSDNHFRYVNIKDGKVDEKVIVEEMINGFNKNSHFDVLLDQFEGVEFEFKA